MMSDERCFVCAEGRMRQGALCDGCLERLARDDGVTIEGISRSGDHGGAWLADRWGRLHALAPFSRIGREGPEVRVLGPSVSRRHAILWRTERRWLIEDAGSRNGTRLNGALVGGPRPLRHGDVVEFGAVALLFASAVPRPGHVAAAPPLPSTPEMSGSLSSIPIELHIPSRRRFRLLEPGSGGGIVVIDGVCVPLPLLQFRLVERLVRQLEDQSNQPAPVRGFVASEHLLADLPWETPLPDKGHLKQLVRRVRGLLSSHGLAIEGAYGLGYRLWSRSEAS